MTLNDLMDVWRTQDAAPLHGFNETLLRLALREDEAKLRARRRRATWFSSLGIAMLVGLMALFVAIMIDPYDDDVLSGWDYAVAAAGMAGALALSVLMYVGYRAQVRREQRFGDSLRDQLNRQLEVIDSWRMDWRDWRHVTIMVLGFVCAAALTYVSARIDDKPYGEALTRAGASMLHGAIIIVVMGFGLRRWARRDLVPRKQRLVALLEQLKES